MQKRLSLIILPVVFLGITYFLFFNQQARWVTFTQTSENRQLDTFPGIKLAKLDAFPKDFESYLNDRFTFRKPFLDVYHRLKFNMHISPHPDKVIIGDDNWLFFGMEEQQVYTGGLPFYEPQLDSFRNIWRERLQFCAQHQAAVYWLIAPSKQRVYSEYLPIHTSRHHENRTLKLMKMLNRSYPGFATYPLSSLLKAKGNTNLYFKLDNHWNSAGAYVGYCELMQLIRQGHPEITALQPDDLSWGKKYQSGGNLTAFIGYDDKLGETIPQVIFSEPGAVTTQNFGYPIHAGPSYPSDYEFHYRNPKARNKQRVLIIRDSFGDALMPFLNETFAETLCIFDSWEYLLHPDMIEKFKPDIIVFLTLETKVGNLLDKQAE